jgi:hypothetical protein
MGAAGFLPQDSLKVSQVGEILLSSRSRFVPEQVILRDERNAHAVNHNRLAAAIAGPEINPGSLVDYFDPNRRATHAKDTSHLGEVLFGYSWRTKSVERSLQSIDICFVYRDEDVEVRRSSRRSVDSHGPAAQKQVLDLVLVQ